MQTAENRFLRFMETGADGWLKKRGEKRSDKSMKIVIIDGQGGKMGKGLIEQLKTLSPKVKIWAVGTNSIATATMLKAGADFGATGENPVVVNCADADIIAGPMGIVIADSLHGEITPNMAVAVGRSKAHKILLPVNKCRNTVVGAEIKNINELVEKASVTINNMLTNLS